jgi:predicted Zn-dependent protease
VKLPSREDLVAQTRRAWEMVQAGNFAEALDVVREVVAACVAANFQSAHVHWVAAVAADQAGKPVDALRYVLKAIDIDPVLLPAHHSLGIIVDRARKKLVAGDLDADEGMTLYQALADNSLADDACRLSYAQHLLDYEKPDEALQVAQAVALLNPRLSDAWRLVGAAAAALGRDDLASEAALRCQAARGSDGWDSVPRSAWGSA